MAVIFYVWKNIFVHLSNSFSMSADTDNIPLLCTSLFFFGFLLTFHFLQNQLIWGYILIFLSIFIIEFRHQKYFIGGSRCSMWKDGELMYGSIGTVRAQFLPLKPLKESTHFTSRTHCSNNFCYLKIYFWNKNCCNRITKCVKVQFIIWPPRYIVRCSSHSYVILQYPLLCQNGKCNFIIPWQWKMTICDEQCNKYCMMISWVAERIINSTNSTSKRGKILWR